METLLKDIRYGLRSLLKRPGFTAIAVVTLALGIGANTAIFTVVNAVLLRPLPFPESERVMWLGQEFSSGPQAAGQPKFIFWREQSQSFESMAAYEGFRGGGNLAGGNEAEYVGGLHVSADFFRVLGVNPIAGRSFTAEDDTAESAPVAILSERVWRRYFGADLGLVGKTILLNGKSVAVVGIMPAQLDFFRDADLFEPLRASLKGDPNPNSTVIARLKRGVTQAQAQAEMRLIADKYRALNPKAMQPVESVAVTPYQQLYTSDVQGLLWILLGAVAFLLLIACANVANLQLTRAAARQKEMAVRLALGASGRRIVKQLLTEGVLLSLCGGLAGLLLAWWATQLLVAALPEGFISRSREISFDGRVLLFTLAVVFVTGLLFGLAPAWQALRVNVNGALKETARQGGGNTRGRLRSGLVVAEVALSLVLLAGASLLVHSFVNLRGVATGFDANNVLSFRLDLKGERYDSASKESTFYRDMLERIGHLPGVDSVAVTNVLPLQAQFNMPVMFPGRTDPVSTQLRLVTPEYFQVLKIPVLKGRLFSAEDKSGTQPLVVVNESFARRFLSGIDPFAQTVTIGRGLDDSPRSIVAVVGDVKQFGLDKASPPMVYLPLAQVPDKLLGVVRRYTSTYVAVRTTGPPQDLIPALKREIATLDPGLPLASVRRMDQIVARSIAPQRFNMWLIAAFAGVGLALAAVGIYGVMSYSVAQRTNELGIRIALGAQTIDVVKLIVRKGITLALIGIAIGLAGAFGLTRLMASLLFGVTPTDAVTFVSVTIGLFAVALLACYIPARRATKVDPLVALRYE
jgi:putative ABC transport system permease protein